MARDVLTRRERARQYRRHMQLKQEAMTPGEVSAAMKKAMHEALDARGTVERSDLLRANIPPAAIDTRFRIILAEVLAERKNGDLIPVVAMNWDRRQ